MSADTLVFVTGASGFLARHVILRLLKAGYRVRGSVRSLEKGDSVRSTMVRELGAPVDDDRLEFVTLDLTRDQGWDTALEGAGALLHTASPFPLAQPKNEGDLIRPAVDGTLRALNAAHKAGVRRVVLTSSVVAIAYRDPMPMNHGLTEADWTDPDSAACHAYAKSKTLAERAAWGFVADHPEMQLTTINPGLIAGAPLDDDFASSTDLIARFLRGQDPAQPNLMVDVVDVRDIAEMHVRALERPETIGERLIGVAGPMWFAEFARTLKAAYPDRRISTRVAPDWFIRFYATFDRAARSILPHLGKKFGCSNDKAREVLGIEFIPAKDAVLETARFLVANGHVR